MRPAPPTAGLVAVQDDPSERQETSVAARVPKETVVPNAVGSPEPATAFTRFVPVMTTTSPPAVPPDAGAMPVTAGRADAPGTFHRCPWPLIGAVAANWGSSATYRSRVPG